LKGTAVVNASLANNGFYNSEGGERQRITIWVDLNICGKPAENFAMLEKREVRNSSLRPPSVRRIGGVCAQRFSAAGCFANSSSEQNMRNITRGELRTAFVASVGNVVIIAD
jgi:hypothetical protein